MNIFKRIKIQWRLLQIATRLTVIETELSSTGMFWNFQLIYHPKRDYIMGIIDEQYELVIEEANLLLKLKRYDLYEEVCKQLKIIENNRNELGLMLIQAGVITS